MKKLSLCVSLFILAVPGFSAVLLESSGTPVTETFDSLAPSGSSSVLPNGWGLLESGSSARVDGAYTAGSGSSSTGDSYGFGTSGSTDRAFGEITTSTFQTLFGVEYRNVTGEPISSLRVGFVGEQWRLGALGRQDRLDFAYSTDATALNNGTWIAVNSLDFIAPVSAGSLGVLDGNAVPNRAFVTDTVFGLNVPDNSSLWMRWASFDATSSDDALAIDDLQVEVVPEPGSVSLLALGVLLVAIVNRHRRG